MQASNRNISIDRFRGFAVISMILVQLWRDFDNLEFLSKLGSHKASDGLTIIEGLRFADIFAPMFLFAIALTYKSSYFRHCSVSGQSATYKHFIKRYVSLIGLGGVIRGIESLLFFIINGRLEKRIDILFFVFIIILFLSSIGYVFAKFQNRETMKNFFSKIVFISLSIVAFLCLLSSTRDFFAQLIVHNKYYFKPWGYWEALQAIGATGLVVLPFMKMGTSKRFFFATVIFFIYTLFHEYRNNSDIISIYAQQGGVFGVFGHCSFVLYASVLADIYDNKMKENYKYPLIVGFFGVLGLIVLQYIYPTMRSVSPSYILLNLSISGFLFFLFCSYEPLYPKFDILSLYGKNPLLMYILQYVLVYGAKEIIGYDTIKSASDFFAIIFTVIIMSILTGIVFWLNKKQIIIKV